MRKHHRNAADQEKLQILMQLRTAEASLQYAASLLGEARRKAWGTRTTSDRAQQELTPLLDRIDAFLAANGGSRD